MKKYVCLCVCMCVHFHPRTTHWVWLTFQNWVASCKGSIATAYQGVGVKFCKTEGILNLKQVPIFVHAHSGCFVNLGVVAARMGTIMAAPCFYVPFRPNRDARPSPPHINYINYITI